MDHGTPSSVAGRYELLEQVGAGGSGRVFRAHDAVLDRIVAVKLLRPGHDEVARGRLRAEARIAACLSHPSIARVNDFGEEMVGGEPTPFVVMEYVGGTTLRDALRAGPLPPAQVIAILTQVADALAHIHRAGVVHRDVKPGNIMLTTQGRVVLLDFGIARQSDLDPLTATGLVVGTVDYLSPEQAAGQSATARSDLYSLGLVAYEALTANRPLTRDTQVATLVAHATNDVPPLPASVPAGLRALVDQLVRRDPAERPADAAVVAQQIRALAADPGRRPAAGASVAAGRPRPRGRRTLAAALAAVAVVAGALALVADPDHSGDGAVAAASGATAPAPSASPRARSTHSQSRTPVSQATRQRVRTEDHAFGPSSAVQASARVAPRRAAAGLRKPGKAHAKGKGHAKGKHKSKHKAKAKGPGKGRTAHRPEPAHLHKAPAPPRHP